MWTDSVSATLLPVAPDTITNTSSRSMTGARLPSTTRNHGGTSVLNEMMNVTRYRASGMTHRSGMLAMSVDMWNVTASMKLLGTNASRIHLATRSGLGGGS